MHRHSREPGRRMKKMKMKSNTERWRPFLIGFAGAKPGRDMKARQSSSGKKKKKFLKKSFGSQSRSWFFSFCFLFFLFFRFFYFILVREFLPPLDFLFFYFLCVRFFFFFFCRSFQSTLSDPAEDKSLFLSFVLSYDLQPIHRKVMFGKKNKFKKRTKKKLRELYNHFFFLCISSSKLERCIQSTYRVYICQWWSYQEKKKIQCQTQQ